MFGQNVIEYISPREIYVGMHLSVGYDFGVAYVEGENPLRPRESCVLRMREILT